MESGVVKGWPWWLFSSLCHLLHLKTFKVVTVTEVTNSNCMGKKAAVMIQESWKRSGCQSFITWTTDMSCQATGISTSVNTTDSQMISSKTKMDEATKCFPHCTGEYCQSQAPFERHCSPYKICTRNCPGNSFDKPQLSKLTHFTHNVMTAGTMLAALDQNFNAAGIKHRLQVIAS